MIRSQAASLVMHIDTQYYFGTSYCFLLYKRPKCEALSCTDQSTIEIPQEQARGTEGEKTMAGEGDLKLLGLALSPFVIRVRMALTMKGVSYEYIEQDLFNKSELLLSSNPVHKKVPVLIHNGKPISETQIIVQYVDEVWGATGPSILPADPYERAIARFWAAYVDDKLFPAVYGCIMKAATEEERAEKVKETLAVIGNLEEAFAKCSNGKAFFAGDSIGYLDLALGSHLFWLEALCMMFGVALVDAGKTPLLAAWAERFGEAEEAKAVVPEADKVVEHAKKLQAMWAAAAAAAK